MNEKENMQVLIANADCEEQEISISDLCYRVLKRWRSILALLLIGAVLGCAAGGLMSAASTDFLSEEDSAEWLEIEVLRGKYQAYQTQVQKDADSYLMKLDADESCYTGTVRYYVDAKAIGGIGLLPELLNIKNDDRYLQELQQITGFDGDVRDLAAVVNYEFTESHGAAEEDAKSRIVTSGVITYTVSLVNEQQCRETIDYIDSRMDALYSECRNRLGDYVQIRGEESIEEDPDAIREQQHLVKQVQLEKYNAYAEYLATLEKSGNYEDMDAIQALVEELETPHAAWKQTFKFGVIFGLGAAFAWVFLLALRYLMDGRVHTASDVSKTYKLNVIARVYAEGKKKSRLDRRIDSLFGMGQFGRYSSAEYAAQAMGSVSGESICIAKTCECEACDEVIAQIKEHARVPVICGMLHQDMELIEKGRENGGVILAVVPGVTGCEDLENAMDICRTHKLPAAGVILIEKD